MLILAGVSRYMVQASRVELRRVDDAARCDEILAASRMGSAAAKKVLACPELASGVPHAQKLATAGQVLPVHFVVDGARKIHRSALASAQTWPWPMPGGNLWEVVLPDTDPLAGQLFVLGAAPEAVLRARTLTVGQTAALVTTLCGTYRWDPQDEKRGVRYDVVPALSKERLTELVDQLPLRPKAREDLEMATELAFEGCASPAEAKFTTFMSFPADVGGMSHKRPFVNDPLPLVGDALVLAGGRQSVRFDDHYRENTLALEYQGLADHDNDAALQADSAKQLAAGAHGIEVWPVTRQTVSTYERLRAFSSTLGRRLGESRVEVTPEQELLQRQLYVWLYRRPWVW